MRCDTSDPVAVVFHYTEGFVSSFFFWSLAVLVACLFLSFWLWNRLPPALYKLAGLFPIASVFAAMMFIGRPSLNDPLIVVANDSLCIQTGRLRRFIEYGRIVSIERRHYSLRGSKTVLNIRLVTGEVTVWTLPDMWGQYERGIDDALFARGVRLVKYRDDKVEP